MAKNSALLWPGLSSPLLILTGEPTSNLDSKSSQTVIRPFRQAKSALGATIFMVPHESFDISSCDRVEILLGWSDMANSGARVAGAKHLSGPAAGRHLGHGQRVRPMKTFIQVYAALGRKNKGQ